MTDQNNAAQPVLTEEEIIALEIAAGGTFTQGPVPFARAIETALLSKLRAEGVQAGDAVQWPTMPPSKGQSPVLFEDGYAEGWAKCLDECRRAIMASAPVAGEPRGRQGVSVERLAKDPFLAAQLWRNPVDRAPVAGEAYQGDSVAERLDNMADDQHPGSQAQSDLYAAATHWRKHIAHRTAPQASEADPLQGAADWLMRAFEPPLSASDLARQLVIGYNRATRLRDAALSAQPGAQATSNDGGE